jgi:hypothetical protein
LKAGDGPGTNNYDATVSKAFLFVDLIVVPAGGVKLRKDVLTAGVGFGDHLSNRSPDGPPDTGSGSAI